MRLRPSPRGAMLAAILLPFGCATVPTGSSSTVASVSTSASFRGRSDLSWGAVPTANPDSNHTGLSCTILGSAAVTSRIQSNMPGSWSSSPVQGTAEIAYRPVPRIRFNAGVQASRSPAIWSGAGVYETGRSPASMFVQLDYGYAWKHADIDVRAIHSWSQSVSDGNTTHIESRSDTSYSKKEFDGAPFFRIGCGFVPVNSGPWFMLQFLAGWTLAEWPGGWTQSNAVTTTETNTLWGGTSADTSRAMTSSTQETQSYKASALAIGLGWNQRIGANTYLAGVRFVGGTQTRAEIVFQASYDLGP